MKRLSRVLAALACAFLGHDVPSFNAYGWPSYFHQCRRSGCTHIEGELA